MMRVLRIAAFRPLSWSSKAHASYSPEADIVQLVVPIEWYSLRRPKPGTFFYLTIVSDAKPRLQSHPFTVASVNTTAQEAELGERTALLAASNSSESLTKPESHTSLSSVQFLIRPYDGFTAQLRELAQESKSFQIQVDGPYGTSHSLRAYSHVIFIAGGTGIVTPISYMPCLVGKSNRKPVVGVHWAVREPAFANLVLEHHLDNALRSENLSMTLYASSVLDQQTACSGLVSQEMGRPNIAAIIAAAATSAECGRLAIVACGPEGMLDDARSGVVCALKTASCTIDYFQDSFAW